MVGWERRGVIGEKGLKWAPRMSDWPRYLVVMVEGGDDGGSNRGGEVRGGGRGGENVGELKCERVFKSFREGV